MSSQTIQSHLPQPNDRMVTTLFLAALLHGIVILGVTFSSPGGDADNDQAPGLEVILVNDNAQSVKRNAKARYLATSGAEQVICWPFFGGGPWGKTPLTLGGREARLVTRVAPHPKDEMVAAGYEDGMIILGPLDGRMEMLIHPPVAKSGAGVVGLAWNSAGDCLFAALENGSLMLFTVESVKNAVTHA